MGVFNGGVQSRHAQFLQAAQVAQRTGPFEAGAALGTKTMGPWTVLLPLGRESGVTALLLSFASSANNFRNGMSF